MRLNKFISETGVCSRREADKLIENGAVTVNGSVAVVGTQVEESDQVSINGKPLGRKKPPIYIALNKPVGITCTTERHIDGNIIDFINHPERIFPIGRLDKDSDGLILLTNNGDIVNDILRAEHHHEKEYIVAVDRPITHEFINGMRRGVRLAELNATTKPCIVEKIGGNTFKIILTQGLNRQIRRMCEAFGYNVRHLQRVRIMNILLGKLKVGHWRNLNDVELQKLLPNLNHKKSSQPSHTAAKKPATPKTTPSHATAGKERSSKFSPKPNNRTNGSNRKPR
jgi:23S rRNA pseudouridine2604 synthase